MREHRNGEQMQELLPYYSPSFLSTPVMYVDAVAVHKKGEARATFFHALVRARQAKVMTKTSMVREGGCQKVVRLVISFLKTREEIFSFSISKKLWQNLNTQRAENLKNEQQTQR